MYRCGSDVQRSLMNDRHYGGAGPALQKDEPVFLIRLTRAGARLP